MKRQQATPDIRAMLQQLGSSSPPLLGELDPAEQLVWVESFLVWLDQVEKRTRSSLLRRADQRRSNEADLGWYRLLRANAVQVHDRLAKEHP